MSDQASVNLPDTDAYKRWKPDAQAKALTRLREAENNAWTPFYCKNLGCNGQPHVWPNDARDCPNQYGHEWRKQSIHLSGQNIEHWDCKHCEVQGTPLDDWTFTHARVDQRPPKWTEDWLTLLMRGGRGSGKTRTGAEITNRASEIAPRIILIGSTGPDLRATMVEGESGILATSPPGRRPTWEPSKKQLTWPNGCIGLGFSAEEPDRLRGPQSGYVWADEPAHWPAVEAAWDNMLFGLRLKNKRGLSTKVVATSTPKPIPWMKELIKNEMTVDRVVSTYANISNLDSTYKKTVLERFEGTRTGQQELHGELLEDVEGAMWNWEMMQYIPETPDLAKIVIGVDPAGTANKRSDETGIIVVGIGHDKNIYVLADFTDKYSPAGWGNMVVKQFEEFSANDIVAEKNFGADMVKYVLDTEAEKRNILTHVTPVTSRRGKDIRAEPIVALYERNRVFHVGNRGDLLRLENEQTTWVPHESPSPNRVDALVHGITALAKNVMPASIASPSELNGLYRLPTSGGAQRLPI